MLLILSSLYVNLIGISTAQATHDVAVVSVTPYPNMVGLGLNESVDLTVVVENQGTENENFSVTVSYNSTLMEVQNVTDLTPNTNTTLNFAWNTSGVAVGRYFFNATASFVSGETDTADNTFTSISDPINIDVNTVSVVSPYIAVLPQRTVDTTLTPGKNYTISIYTNYNGSDIWGYQFVLTYNPSVLEGVEVVNGDLITEGDVTFVAGTFNNTKGELSLTLALSENKSAPYPYPLLNNTGPGVLANVTFTIVGEGDSPIEFDTRDSKMKKTTGTNIIDTNIIDWITHLDPDPTKGKFLDGFFQNVEEVIHDIAVTKLDFSPNNVTAGEPVNINVTIKNKGSLTEEVSVTVYWGFHGGLPLHLIGDPETVTIGSGENKTMPFTWDTTEVSWGTHPLVAVVDYSFVGIEDANPLDNMLKKDNAVTVKACPSTPCPDYVALNATYHALLANYSDLLDYYNELLGSHDSLVNNFDSLNSSYYGLQSSYDSLNSTYYDLLDVYNQLKSDYDDFESKHDTLTGDLGTARNLSYLFIITTIVFIATTAYLAIRKLKVKPELKTT